MNENKERMELLRAELEELEKIELQKEKNVEVKVEFKKDESKISEEKSYDCPNCAEGTLNILELTPGSYSIECNTCNYSKSNRELTSNEEPTAREQFLPENRKTPSATYFYLFFFLALIAAVIMGFTSSSSSGSGVPNCSARSNTYQKCSYSVLEDRCICKFR